MSTDRERGRRRDIDEFINLGGHRAAGRRAPPSRTSMRSPTRTSCSTTSCRRTCSPRCTPSSRTWTRRTGTATCTSTNASSRTRTSRVGARRCGPSASLRQRSVRPLPRAGHRIRRPACRRLARRWRSPSVLPGWLPQHPCGLHGPPHVATGADGSTCCCISTPSGTRLGRDLELWSRDDDRCEARVPRWATGCCSSRPVSIRSTGTPIRCRHPTGIARQSLALYYFTEEATRWRSRPTTVRGPTTERSGS